METRAGLRVLASNEIAAVTGGSVWDAYKYGHGKTMSLWVYLLANPNKNALIF